jgi:hypothetical protein
MRLTDLHGPRLIAVQLRVPIDAMRPRSAMSLGCTGGEDVITAPIRGQCRPREPLVGGSGLAGGRRRPIQNHEMRPDGAGLSRPHTSSATNPTATMPQSSMSQSPASRPQSRPAVICDMYASPDYFWLVSTAGKRFKLCANNCCGNCRSRPRGGGGASAGNAARTLAVPARAGLSRSHLVSSSRLPC